MLDFTKVRLGVVVSDFMTDQTVSVYDIEVLPLEAFVCLCDNVLVDGVGRG